MPDVQYAAHQGLDYWVGRHARQQVDAPVLDVSQAWREAEAEERAEAEHVAGRTTRVGVMLADLQAGSMRQQAVQDVRCFGRGRRDYFGMERPELVGDVRVEGDTRLIAMTSIHVTQAAPLAPRPEVLPVG